MELFDTNESLWGMVGEVLVSSLEEGIELGVRAGYRPEGGGDVGG